MSGAQINLLEEIIVDNFAGGGGASTGIELATGRPVTIAINHDPDAILMHKTNHPFTEHYQASVWDVDPCEVSKGRPVGLAWFSSDCKHFSKAKGGKPVDKNIRGLPCPSIFDTREAIREKYGLSAQRPLRPNTMRRVIRGVDKFAIKAPEPFLVVVNHAGDFRGQNTADPLQTVTAKHGYGVASPLLAPLTMHNNENATGTNITEPVNTITSSGAGGHQMVITPAMIQYHTEQTERVRGQGLADPLMTIDASNRYGLAAASLVKYYGSDQHGQGAGDPLHTITAKDREGVLAANLAKFYGGTYTGSGSKMSDPLHTVTAVDHNALTATHLVKMKGTNLGGPMSEPVQTITAGGGHFGVVTTVVVKAEPGADLKHWPEIRDLLNTYCGYNLGAGDVILFQIGETAYFMADIGLRMLTPRELYMANGFPQDYKIERDYTGREYPKTKQVARCGNAVPPPFATALVRANLPEWCGVEINTMEELEKAVAV